MCVAGAGCELSVIQYFYHAHGAWGGAIGPRGRGSGLMNVSVGHRGSHGWIHDENK